MSVSPDFLKKIIDDNQELDLLISNFVYEKKGVKRKEIHKIIQFAEKYDGIIYAQKLQYILLDNLWNNFCGDNKHIHNQKYLPLINNKFSNKISFPRLILNYQL